MNICIRAIDYCPPVDIQFGEFLRAIITANSDLVRDDQWDYRGEFIKAFRLRGIIPEDVTSYSEEALRWWGPEQTGQKLKPCEGLIYDVVNGDDPRSESIAASNRWALEEYSQQYARELGLFSDSPGSRPRFKVHSCDPIIRLGPDGQMAKSFVVEFLQERMINSGSSGSPSFIFRGGSTVIFNGEGRVQYVIQKKITSADRLKRQRDYEAQQIGQYGGTTFGQWPGPCSFAAIHRGY